MRTSYWRLMLAAAAFSMTASLASALPSSTVPLPFVLQQVGPGIYAAIDGPDHKAGSNAGFVIGDDGVLVIDAFFNVDAAKALVSEIRRMTAKPIRYVVNTHYHIDHTGGDQALRDAGAIIIAHSNVRSWIRTANENLLGDRLTPQIRSRIAALPLPDLVTDKDLTVWLGSRKIVVSTIRGHTGGDLSVSVPDAKVLFTGDLLWRRIAPNLIDGSVSEWSATDAEFARMPDAGQMTYVPGHGGVASLKDVQEFRAYLSDLKRLVEEGRRAGLAGEALIAVEAPKLKALHPDWTIGDRSAAAEIRYMDQELAGTKKRPVQVTN